MTLSDKIIHEEAIKVFIDNRSNKWIKMESVKQFIKDLNGEFPDEIIFVGKDIKKIIKERAGDELI